MWSSFDKLKENKSQLYGGLFGSTNQRDDREEQSHPSVKRLGFNLTDDNIHCNIHTLQPAGSWNMLQSASTSLPVHRFAVKDEQHTADDAPQESTKSIS